jgi:hypothetical protein
MAGTDSYSQDQRNQTYQQFRNEMATRTGKSLDDLTPEEIAEANRLAEGNMAKSSGEVRNPTYGNVLGYTQQQVDRSRSLGEAAAARAAYEQNYGGYDAAMAQSQAARGQQQDALGLSRAAAMGQAPSQAEGLGRNMIDQSLQAQMAGAASARGGGLAQAAAMRQAQNQSAVTQAQGSNQLAALRAQEMAQARGEYMAGAGALRQADYGGAGLGMQRTALETQNAYRQRDLNQQAQQFYEQQASGIYSDQLHTDQQVTGFDRTGEMQSDERDSQRKSAAIGGAASAAAGIFSMFSDARAKVPLSLSEVAMLSDMQSKEPLAADDPLMTTTMGAQSGYAVGTPQFERASMAQPRVDEC